MKPLIPDKDTARQYVRVNFINDESSLPDFELAAQRYLIPIIGQDLYDAITDDDEDQDDPLLLKCRAVVAPLGYLMELATIHIQITDSGLKTAYTENLQPAHRWEFNEVRDHLADKGSFAMEMLLKYLFDNKTSLPLWTDSDEYGEMSKLIFTSADDFKRYYGGKIFNPLRVWWELRPLISEVEDFYIKPAIGEDFFQELKDGETPTDQEKASIDLIKKVVAHSTIKLAIEKMAVQITPQGFTVLLSAANNDSFNAGDAPARDPQLTMLYDSFERSSEAYQLQLKEYLNNTASGTVLDTYFESDKYVAPPTSTPESPNKCRKIFGL